jgi:MmyB-like transcription regulator ligand binding domain/Helix-turn-helix domain
VASLAGIGVSWYTSLENGDARGVSEATLGAVADALRLSDSEREYLMAIAARAPLTDRREEPGPLAVATMQAIAFPAYIITATWDVIDFNQAFRRVWELEEDEASFNAIARLFIDPRARMMHGPNFSANIKPVLAMLQSSLGRQPHAEALRQLRDRLIADSELRTIWDEYEINSPLLPNACTIESPIGTFSYETLTLLLSSVLAMVVQVPDGASRERLIEASTRT